MEIWRLVLKTTSLISNSSALVRVSAFQFGSQPLQNSENQKVLIVTQEKLLSRWETEVVQGPLAALRATLCGPLSSSQFKNSLKIV